MLALHTVTNAPGETLHLTARALNVIGPVWCPAPGNVDDSVDSICAGTVLKTNSTGQGQQGPASPHALLIASKPGDILLHRHPVSLVKACEDHKESSRSDAVKDKDIPVPHHASETSSNLQNQLLEKLEEMEEEMKEVHSEMKEKRHSQTSSALLQSSESSEAASFLHSLCGGDCSRSFQEKIAKSRDMSFVREFTGWWIRRGAE